MREDAKYSMRDGICGWLQGEKHVFCISNRFKYFKQNIVDGMNFSLMIFRWKICPFSYVAPYDLELLLNGLRGIIKSLNLTTSSSFLTIEQLNNKFVCERFSLSKI